MKRNSFYGIAVLVFLAIVGCGKDDDSVRTELGNKGSNSLIEGADGSLYSVSCLHQIAGALQSSGSSALSQCLVSNPGSADSSDNRGRLGFGWSASWSSPWGNPYSWITYSPLTYYAPTYYQNYSQPVSYNPYNDNRFRNDSFCSFAFGGNFNYNCYFVFGYNNYNSQNYNNRYDASCSDCVYAHNYDRCYSRRCVK